MTAPNQTPPKPQQLIFAAYHQAGLIPGEYEVRLEQTITTPKLAAGDQKYIAPTTFPANRRFHIEGERFQLTADEIQAKFPPDGSLGDHSNVLPHIVLTNSTFPWQFSPNGQATIRPWLMLLVFSEDEKPEPLIKTVDKLAADGAKYPANAGQRANSSSNQVLVIDLPRRVLEPLLPTLDELATLAHVRRTDLDASELAVIIANRLPAPGKTSTVHLVSLRQRYDAAGNFDFQGAQPGDLIRLVSLASWRFACVSNDQTFAAMVKGLERDHRSFRLPFIKPEVEQFLQDGFVPVRHRLRQGGRTLSWYRGPFVTGSMADNPLDTPVATADSLLGYHAGVGMLDVSYAAAWELGRLTALQSSTFSSSLYAWKRLRDQVAKRAAHPEQQDHPLALLNEEITMPESVRTWLEQINRLQGVPFKYLVPDERLLPKESIRFFWIDPNWLRCLLDGAYSIGRVTADDLLRDKTMPVSVAYTKSTGVLIRSDIISGYPGLLIDGYDAQDNHLTSLSRQNLSDNILLCLFDGELARLDIHQKPELLHFALELLEEDRFQKTLRRAEASLPIVGTLHNGRIVPIKELTDAMQTKLKLPAKTFHAGHFAFHILEQAERVSFYRGNG